MSENKELISFDERLEDLGKLTDEQLSKYQFSLVYNPSRPDMDPVALRSFGTSYYDSWGIKELQEELWRKFNSNPQINSAVRDYVGRMVGKDFEVYSEIPEIQEKINEIVYDYRNRLTTMLPKYVGRSQIEGELFLVLTLHKDGFVEIDFRDPSTLDSFGYDNSGIIFHPRKPAMPLAYQFVYEGDDLQQHYELIPSIYIARYPEMQKYIDAYPGIMKSYLDESRADKNSGNKFKAIGGYKRFVVQWDRGWLTSRNLSYIRTVLVWINAFEELKKYEIDHKKSSGAYLWIVEVEDAQSFRAWLALSDEEKAKTGIMAKKSAGGTMILPPGMKMKSLNPQLPKISDSDTDILDFVLSGLNVSDDMLMGRSNRNKSGLSETHGTQSDRTADELSNFERFLKYDFWAHIFFLASKVSSFKYEYNVMKAVDFNKNKKPIFKRKKLTAEHLIDFVFPESQNGDLEGRTKALLGVKHNSVSGALGVPLETIARKLGFSSYKAMRLKSAEEEEMYPELIQDMDAETKQENVIENPKNTPEKK
jgi:hypothetical protein